MAEEDPQQVNSFVQWRHAPASRWIFCPLCGEKLTDHIWDGKMRRYCTHCGFVYWERPLPAAAAVILDATNQQVVIVTRRFPPKIGGKTLPGGGVEAGESVEHAVIREVEEETGLIVAVDKEIGTWSTPSQETIISFYLTHPVSGMLQAGTDALSAEWYALDKLPVLDFDLHQNVMEQIQKEWADHKL
ncbi:MAG: NUDIX domain-containing protein [Firmicutes bacterium]|nr:NUDIX domain-containing protein [Bacillota bacterium]